MLECFTSEYQVILYCHQSTGIMTVTSLPRNSQVVAGPLCRPLLPVSGKNYKRIARNSYMLMLCWFRTVLLQFLPEIGNRGWHNGPPTSSEVLGKLGTVMLRCSSAYEGTSRQKHIALAALLVLVVRLSIGLLARGCTVLDACHPFICLILTATLMQHSAVPFNKGRPCMRRAQSHRES